MITRNEAIKFLESQINNKNIIKHMLACEAIMAALAKKFEPESSEEWAMAGLLHDGDYKPDVKMEEQGIRVAKILEEKGYQIPETVKQTMATHNWRATKVEPQSKMDWSLFCCDTLTGLIVAVALVRPEKKLSAVTLENIQKKWKEKSFAAGTRREDIALCEEKLGISLSEFITIGLTAMQKISNDLGL